MRNAEHGANGLPAQHGMARLGGQGWPSTTSEVRCHRLGQGCACSPYTSARLFTVMSAAETPDEHVVRVLSGPKEPTSQSDLLTPWDPAVRRECVTDTALGEGAILDAKYRLIKLLGTGGMGTVWLARNELLQVDVAIKLIRPDLDDSRLSQRLVVEARAAAQLGHPNIVRIFDVSHTPSGAPFIVMELLRGRDLADIVRRESRLSATTAVRTLLPIVHALAVAHEAGLVHRDLKPENIFLAEQDNVTRPTLLDFGIVKLSRNKTQRLTDIGDTVGSPEYMAPEQARGDDVDAAADIWAFSMVLYEAVTGHLPFSDPNYNRLIRHIIEDPIPPFTPYDIHEDELFAIVERGLRKDPKARWRSMRVMGVELGQWLLDQGVEEDITNTAVRPTWLPVVRSRHTRVSSVPKAEQLPRELVETRAASSGPPRESLTWALGRRGGWLLAGGVVTVALVVAVASLITASPPAPSVAASSRTQPSAVTAPALAPSLTPLGLPVIEVATVATGVASAVPTARSLGPRKLPPPPGTRRNPPSEASPPPVEESGIEIKTDF